MRATTKDIATIPVNIRFVVYRQDENNGYDDSDFYYMIHDRVENKIIKHVYGTTRCGGYAKFDGELFMLVDGFTSHYEYEKKFIQPIAKKQVLALISSYDVEIGDIVTVSNPRVRSFKNETFKVSSKKDYTLRYGKVASTTLFGENGKGEAIKTAESNVTIMFHNDKKIEDAAFRLAVGMSLR
jgi:hypothetical protein